MSPISKIHPLKNAAPAAAVALMLVAGLGDGALAAQDKYALKALNGVAFSEFRGYEDWSVVAVSQTAEGTKAIVANPVMISAYKAGVLTSGKPFPDGSKIAKIEWSPKKDTASPYPVQVPDVLKSVAFIEKDSKRFPASTGWGYAQFAYEPGTDSFKPMQNDPGFDKVCYACHTAVAKQDYIFTHYPIR